MHTHTNFSRGQCGSSAAAGPVLPQSRGSPSPIGVLPLLSFCPWPWLAEQASGIREASFLEASRNPFLVPPLPSLTPTSLRNAGLKDISANAGLYLLFFCYCLWKTNNVPDFKEVLIRGGKWCCESLNTTRIRIIKKAKEEIDDSVVTACLGRCAVKRVWDQSTKRGQFKETLNNDIHVTQVKFLFFPSLQLYLSYFCSWTYCFSFFPTLPPI